MIVNSLESGWEVLYQRNHAMLAAALADAWSEDMRVHPPRLWTETLVAIAQHDDEENFWSDDRTRLNDFGAPLDFTQTTTATTLKKLRFVTEQAARQHRWIATLIARHHLHIYQQARKDDQELDSFLTEQEQAIDIWLAELELGKDILEQTYAIMRWCDRLSLILCQREVPAMGRELDIAPMPNGEMLRVSQREDGTLRLSNWIFHQKDLIFWAEARLLHAPTYNGGEALRQALDSTTVYSREWRFTKSS